MSYLHDPKVLERTIRRQGEVERRSSFGDAISLHLGLPHLRGFWPYSASGAGGAVKDLVAQQDLAIVGTVTGGVLNDRTPYYDFDGATGYVSRGDDAALSVTSRLLLGCWAYFDTLTSSPTLIGKYQTAGNQRSYLLQVLSTGAVRLVLSVDGTAFAIFDTATGLVTTGQWYHIVARYTPSTEVAIFINGVKTVFTTSVPAGIFDSTAGFHMASYSGPSNLLDGRLTLGFVSAPAASGLADVWVTRLYYGTRGLFQ